MQNNDEFARLMNENAKDFDNTQASEYGTDVPEGNYVCLVKSATRNKSKNSGRWQISWDLQIVWDAKQKYGNRHIFFYDGLTEVDQNGNHTLSERGAANLKQRFVALGFKPPAANQVDQFVQGLIGSIVAVQLKKNGEFTNVFFRSFVAPKLEALPANFAPPPDVFDLAIAKRTSGTGQASSLPRSGNQPSSPKPKLSFEG